MSFLIASGHPKGLGSRSRLTGESELRIILVGKSGGGKSVTGNTILGQEKFESILAATPVTQTCSEGSRTRNGRKVVVIDTPAIFDTKDADEQTTHEISRCVALSSPGPHALVLVTQLGHFTEEDQHAVRRVQEIFGSKAMKYMIILFTHKEDFRSGTLEQYIFHPDNKQLLQLIEQCQGRYCSFNNKAAWVERAAQAEELMTRIAHMVEEKNKYQVCKAPEKLLKKDEMDKSKDEMDEVEDGMEMGMQEGSQDEEHSSGEPGPHALVLVTQLGRFTEEDQRAVRRVQEIFGPKAMKYTIVLFTRREDLRSGTLEQYISHLDNKQLQELIEQSQGRYCAFNNKAAWVERAAQAEELMTEIARVVEEKKDQPFYTNEMYEKAKSIPKVKAMFCEKDERACRCAKGEAELKELIKTQKSYEKKTKKSNSWGFPFRVPSISMPKYL